MNRQATELDWSSFCDPETNLGEPSRKSSSAATLGFKEIAG